MDLARALRSTGHHDQARVAAEIFVRQGLIAGDRAYRAAENLARGLGARPPPECGHRGSIELVWAG